MDRTSIFSKLASMVNAQQTICHLLLLIAIIMPQSLWALTLGSDGYYSIATPADLKDFADLVNSRNLPSGYKGAKLANNITLTGNNTEQYVIGDSQNCFYGDFDGQGHTVSGVKITSVKDYYANTSTKYAAGLFGAIWSTSAIIQNLTVEGSVSITTGSKHYVGGVIGAVFGALTIRNVTNRVSITDSRTDSSTSYSGNVGGVIGSAGEWFNGQQSSDAITIENCVNDADIIACSSNCVGGIAGYGKNVRIANCLNAANITNNHSFGSTNGGSRLTCGIIGYDNYFGGSCTYCLNVGTLKVKVNGTLIPATPIGFFNDQCKADSIHHNFWKSGSGDSAGYLGGLSGLSDMVEVSDTDLKSGKVCYQYFATTWGQSLGNNAVNDSWPIPAKATNYRVYKLDDQHYYNDIFSSVNSDAGITTTIETKDQYRDNHTRLGDTRSFDVKASAGYYITSVKYGQTELTPTAINQNTKSYQYSVALQNPFTITSAQLHFSVSSDDTQYSVSNTSDITTLKVGDTGYFTVTPKAGYCIESVPDATLDEELAAGAKRYKFTVAEGASANSFAVQTRQVAVIDLPYLCFTNTTSAATDVSLCKKGSPADISLQYTTGDILWTDYTIGTPITLKNQGDKVYFRAGGESGKNATFSIDSDNYYYFTLSNKVAASGNVMSLLDAGCTQTAVPAYAFCQLFIDCTNMTTAPELPATTLAERCYLSMFQNCLSLTTPPALPATTLAERCYGGMFLNCFSLTTAPALPATTLAGTCYADMFNGCESLITAPALPATTLAEGCYGDMFYECTSLTTAPELPATTLAKGCYNSMFFGCLKLSYVKVAFTDWPFDTTEDWLDGVSSVGVFDCPDELDTSSPGPNTIPEGWSKSTVNTPLMFVAQEAGAEVKLDKSGGIDNVYLQYSTDGESWEGYGFGTSISLEKQGDKVYFRAGGDSGKNATFSIVSDNYYHFILNNKVLCGGNVMSLLDPDCRQTSVPAYAFYRLFNNCTNLTTAPALPATTLAEGCYKEMFIDCTSLTTAPALPASTLAQECYKQMFSNCTSLNTAPALPATTLAQECYKGMFSGCTSLTAAPALPATTLAQECYKGMFSFCTRLTTAPALPATTLAKNCYEDMFSCCFSLTTAPALPATTLAESCYDSMFYNCSSLTSAPALPATTLAEYCYNCMFYGCKKLSYVKVAFTEWNSEAKSTVQWLDKVASSGTFICPATLVTSNRGTSTFPGGWNIGYLGDVNSDGGVNDRDLQPLRDHLLGLPDITIDRNKADVNCDGKVTLGDLTRLIQLLSPAAGDE